MLLGDVHIGRYHLLRLIGSGGMGDVYLAEDERIEQQVAFKVMRSELATSSAADALRLFTREAKAIARLDHPHILPLFDFGEETVNGIALSYIVMPYRSAGSLHVWLKKRNELLPLQEVARLVYQAADALQHAHDEQIIHRDVKPSNFLIRLDKERPDQPDLLLADFGLALFSNAAASISKSVHGTPAYMPPEHWEGHAVPATDQYALAAMTYELLTGHPPFEGRPEQVMYQHFRVQPQPLNVGQPHVPASLNAVVLRALSKKPDDRFERVLAFAQAVRSAIQSPESTIAPSISSVELPPALPPAKKEKIPPPPSVPQQMGGEVLQAPISAAKQQPYAALRPVAEEETLASSTPTYEGGPYSSFDQITEKRAPVSGHTMDERVLQVTDERSTISTVGLSGSGPSGAPRKMLLLVACLVLFLLLVGIDIFSIARIQPLVVSGFQATATSYARSLSTAYGATATARARATMAVTTNPYVSTSGPLVLYDPLTDDSKSIWPDLGLANPDAGCRFSDGAYHVSVTKKGYVVPCFSRATYAADFVFEAQMTLIKGDYAGIIFRADGGTSYYYFMLNANGAYEVDYQNTDGGYVIASGSAEKLVHTGLNQNNLLAVVAQGRNFELFVNNQHLVNVTDGLYRTGSVGFTSYESGTATEAAFRNARIWTL